MSGAHLRRVWQRDATRHLLGLIRSWTPPEREARKRQRRVLAALGEHDTALTEVIPEVRAPRHAATPEVRGRAA